MTPTRQFHHYVRWSTIGFILLTTCCSYVIGFVSITNKPTRNSITSVNTARCCSLQMKKKNKYIHHAYYDCLQLKCQSNEDKNDDFLINNRRQSSPFKSQKFLSNNIVSSFSFAMLISTMTMLPANAFDNERNYYDSNQCIESVFSTQEGNNVIIAKTLSNNLGISQPWSNSQLLANAVEEVVNNETKSTKEVAQEGGKWFFIIYVVVSLAAGTVEMTKRFQNWLDNRQKK